MSGNSVDENTIISKITKFDEFNKFYRSEWEPRKTSVSIDWKINPLCDGFAAQGIYNDTGRPWIELQHLPETFDDAFLGAHEIMHVIRYIDKQSFSFQVTNANLKGYEIGKLIELANRLGSMFDDPVIDPFLEKNYGFSPVSHYVKVVIPDTIKKLNPPGDAKDELIRLEQAMFYAQYSLQWDSIKDSKLLNKWREVKRQYGRKRPATKRLGEELYFMSNENGYNTPDKQRQLFDRIADKYGIYGVKLKDIISIV